MAGENTSFSFPDPESDDKPEKGVSGREDGGAEVDLSGGADDIQIEVADDTPPQDRGRAPSEPPEDPTDDELAEYSEKVRKRFKHFTKGYHDERRAKEAAQRERDEAARLAQMVLEENKRLKGTLDVGQNAYVEQSKKVLENELQQAKAKLRAAHESFDPEAIADAQADLTAATIRMDRLQNFRPRPAQQQETVVQPAPEAPAATRLDPNTLAWYGRNQWFGKDRELTRFAEGVHEKLADEGVQPASEEYFRRLDRRLREVFPDRFDAPRGEDRAPERQRTVAAPNRGTAPRKVSLTASQVALAKRLNIPLKEYALQVAEQMRNA